MYVCVCVCIGHSQGEFQWLRTVSVKMGADKDGGGKASGGPQAWVKSDVSTSSSDGAAEGNGLALVGRIVVVSSCKGGVGKSTVAVNTAFALQQQGFKVGLFDADVYGPSLPVLVGSSDAVSRVERGEEVLQTTDKKRIRPLEHLGVKLMSYGLVLIYYLS
jgi:Mrp family chromosome partitioning ATPase